MTSCDDFFMHIKVSIVLNSVMLVRKACCTLVPAMFVSAWCLNDVTNGL